MRPGDTVVLRSVFRGKIRWATPHRVVDHTGSRIAMFVGVGTVGVRPSNYRVKPYAEALLEEWEPLVVPWHTHHVLRLTPFDRGHSLDLYFRESWELAFWYVNLQEPLRATPLGFDTFDQQLDIVVAPDGEWRWKDEEEFEDLVDAGILTAAERDAVRAEGERVLAERPWPTGFEDWRPDASWSLPELPPGWYVV